ncbi:MAG: glycosyltransferase family 2 protein [Planctomycetaceae bacterium]|nr:glycosyltransferase family 2 protein [Planctomycetales bacterium]MCB9873600.1 glycosyltransferase family 2 protein [Planctomycetaceae bacterium]MCB9940150.1 glycosyltransferase family 2 protein [Planctomycetaceae bacterium]
MSDHSQGGPRVSIGLPVFNGLPYVRRAVDSLLAQTFEDFELIISDNCSTDGSSEILHEYAANDSRIRYIRHPHNRGANFNFRFVLNQAQYEYFMFAAHDDSWNPEFIAANLEILQNRDDVVCSMSKAEIERDITMSTDYNRLGTQALLGTRRQNLFWYLVNISANCRFYGLFRRHVLLQCIRDERRYFASDIVIMARTLMFGKHYEVDRVLFRRGNGGVCRNLLQHARDINRDRWVSRLIPVWTFLVEMFRDPLFPRWSPGFWFAVFAYAVEIWFVIYLQQADIKIRALWRWMRGSQ